MGKYNTQVNVLTYCPPLFIFIKSEDGGGHLVLKSCLQRSQSKPDILPLIEMEHFFSFFLVVIFLSLLPSCSRFILTVIWKETDFILKCFNHNKQHEDHSASAL